MPNIAIWLNQPNERALGLSLCSASKKAAGQLGERGPADAAPAQPADGAQHCRAHPREQAQQPAEGQRHPTPGRRTRHHTAATPRTATRPLHHHYHQQHRHQQRHRLVPTVVSTSLLLQKGKQVLRQQHRCHHCRSRLV